MNKETLRMQMLSGIITESEYKAKLEENAASNLELKSLAKQLYMGFKKLGATTKFQTTKMAVGNKDAFTDNNVNIFVDNDAIQVNINSKGIGVPKAEELKNNIKKSFPKVILTPQQGGNDWEGNKIISFALTPGKEMSESLNENFVGIGAINNPFPEREKTDYELAFDHYMGNINEGDDVPTNPEDYTKQPGYISEEDENPIDAITMDVPLFIRMLEFAREDASTDMDLHDLADKAIAMSTEGEVLSMDNYEDLVGAETSEEN
jgi:hypothetical protein